MKRRHSIVRFPFLTLASLSLLLALPPARASAEEPGAAAEAKPEAAAEVKPEAAAEVKPEAAAEAKPEAKQEAAQAKPAAPAETGQGAAAAPQVPSHMVSVKAEPFPESTSVHGEIKTDLRGVWLLITLAEIVPGKFRNFPQIFKVTKGEKGFEFQLLDVRLPQELDDAYKQADRSLAAWTPSEKALATLKKKWSELPKVENKTVNDPPRGKIEYLLSAPDSYGEAFGAMNPVLDKALKESQFGMQIVETYRPIKEVTDTRISQLMQRKVVYGAKTSENGVIKGSSFVGYLASGAGTPLPLQFTGQFVMYRLAEAS
jgi:hypothetical protein